MSVTDILKILIFIMNLLDWADVCVQPYITFSALLFHSEKAFV